jgi:hypothetical protein
MLPFAAAGAARLPPPSSQLEPHHAAARPGWRLGAGGWELHQDQGGIVGGRGVAAVDVTGAWVPTRLLRLTDQVVFVQPSPVDETVLHLRIMEPPSPPKPKLSAGRLTAIASSCYHGKRPGKPRTKNQEPQNQPQSAHDMAGSPLRAAAQSRETELTAQALGRLSLVFLRGRFILSLLRSLLLAASARPLSRMPSASVRRQGVFLGTPFDMVWRCWSTTPTVHPPSVRASSFACGPLKLAVS